MTRREVALAFAGASARMACGKQSEAAGGVSLLRVPEEGLQPQAAVDQSGGLHLIYFRGEASHGDVFYVGSENGGKTFSRPLRVNSQPGSAIATGTIRGAQLAIGRADALMWRGMDRTKPNPKDR